MAHPTGFSASKLVSPVPKTNDEKCGICEKPGGEVFWATSLSHCAHSVCYAEIKDIEVDLMITIVTLFRNIWERNMAHVAAISAVRNELGGVSIKTFLDTKGAAKLKSIFDSAGLAAARSFYSRY